MPSLSLTLPDIKQSVTRPVIYKVLEQLFEITRLSKDTRIYYAGEANVIQTPGTSIDEEGDRDARFGTGRYTFVNVTEQYQTPAMQEIQSHAFDNVPVFEDRDINLSLRPIYLPSDVTIEITYRSNSETEVSRWMAEMLSRASRGRDLNLHRVEYHYPLPFDFVELIEDAWALKEKQGGIGIGFQDYFRSHSTDRLTVLTARDGAKGILAVQEVQSQIIGLFDFVGIPEKPQRDSETGTWEISFAYKFSYQRPDAIYVHYPVAIHNQLMPRRWLQDIRHEEDPQARAHYYSQSYAALANFAADANANLPRQPFPYIRLPLFDDFKPEGIIPGTATIFTALTFITPTDNQTLMNVKDLGDARIDSDILEFLLKSEAPYVNRLYQSFFQLTLYRNGSATAMEKVELLPDGTIRSTVPLDIRHTYHVRLAIVIDVQMLTQIAINRLSGYPKALVKLCNAINVLLRTNPDFQALGNKRSLELWELGPIYWVLTGSTLGKIPGTRTVDGSYPGDNVAAWPGDYRDTFLRDINQDLVRQLLRDKRNRMLTLQIQGIIIHPLIAAPSQGTAT